MFSQITKIKAFVKSLLLPVYYRYLYTSTLLRRYSIKLLSSRQTIDYLINSKCSLSRFGDGEFRLAMAYSTGRENNEGIGFQEYDPVLGKRLYEILTTPRKNHKIGLPSPIFGRINKLLKPVARDYWKNQALKYFDWLYKAVDKDTVYLDSFFSRFYMDYKNHSKCEEYIRALSKIWMGCDLIVVEGELTRFGVGNDLFESASSVRRIICPAKNAFSRLEDIENAIIESADAESLVLVALGPTATIIAADMSACGIRTIDIGHIDIEYEWMRLGVETKVPVAGKYVNEARVAETGVISDEDYSRQIITRIL